MICKNCEYYPCTKTNTIKDFKQAIEFFGINVILGACNEWKQKESFRGDGL